MITFEFLNCVGLEIAVHVDNQYLIISVILILVLFTLHLCFYLRVAISTIANKYKIFTQ